MTLKFKESRESVASPMMLWGETPTQISIEDVYDIKVYPVTTIINEGAINFDIPSQPKGMLANIDIVTKFKVKKGEANLVEADNVTLINNFANSLWELCDIKLADRVDITQSLRNAYGYASFFSNCLNSDANREDYLFATQGFLMDSGKTKTESETLVFTGDGVKNEAASRRAKRIKKSKSITVTAPLHAPLFNTAKCLPTRMKIRVSLTKNSDKFLLMGDDPDYTVILEDVHLIVRYLKPRDMFLNLIEERLLKDPAVFFLSRPEIIVRPITQQSRVIRLNHLFLGRLPKHAFFVLQKSSDFDGTLSSSPYNFIPFSKFQIHIDGVGYFPESLSIDFTNETEGRIYDDNWSYLQQLYRTIGRDMKGTSLINSKNFQLNFMVGLSLTSDRSPTNVGYLNCQGDSSSMVEIDLGYDQNIAEDLVLIIYSVYDQVIKIDGERNIQLID